MPRRTYDDIDRRRPVKQGIADETKSTFIDRLLAENRKRPVYLRLSFDDGDMNIPETLHVLERKNNGRR